MSRIGREGNFASCAAAAPLRAEAAARPKNDASSDASVRRRVIMVAQSWWEYMRLPATGSATRWMVPVSDSVM